MRGFNVEEFLGRMNSGLQSSNRFIFDLGGSVPNALLGTRYADVARQTEWYVDSVEAPAAILMTNEVKRYGYGAITYKPYAPVFGDFNATFRCDQQGLIMDFLHSWMRSALNYHSGGMAGGGTWYRNEAVDAGEIATPASSMSLGPYEVNYPRQYALDCGFTAFRDDGQRSFEYRLHRAFPYMIGNARMAWADRNQHLQVPVSFKFTDLLVTSEPAVR